MTDQQLLDPITLNPKVMTGKPVVKGTRLTVEYILSLLAHGATEKEILEEYDSLVREDIQACLLFATKSLEDTALLCGIQFVPRADRLAATTLGAFPAVDHLDATDK
jgi:uncharacterized protein (DUF433 family)